MAKKCFHDEMILLQMAFQLSVLCFLCFLQCTQLNWIQSNSLCCPSNCVILLLFFHQVCFCCCMISLDMTKIFFNCLVLSVFFKFLILTWTDIANSCFLFCPQSSHILLYIHISKTTIFSIFLFTVHTDDIKLYLISCCIHTTFSHIRPQEHSQKL